MKIKMVIKNLFMSVVLYKLNNMCSLQLILICVSVFFTHGKLEIEYEEAFFKPVLGKTSSFDGRLKEILLENNKIEVQFRCKAQYPIMWVFDADYSQGNEQRRRRWEWTDRKFNNFIAENIYTYSASIHFWYEGKHLKREFFRCQAINSTGDYLTVEMTPLLPNDNQWGGRERVKFMIHYPENGESDDSDTEQPSPAECLVMFAVMYIKQFGYYARCWKIHNGEDSELPGEIVIQNCLSSAAYCSNTLRELKLHHDTCTKVLIRKSSPVNQNWMKLDERFPVTLDCHIKSANTVIRRAQEIFYSSPKLSDTNIHFSWSEINPSEMIWMTKTPESTYYIGENLSTACKVSKYGFSFDPVIILKLNSESIYEERDYIEEHPERLWNKPIHYILNLPGKYELQCVAPVWNTTEWARKIASFEVIDTISPYFDIEFENITLYVDDANKRIKCIGHGDPTPTFEWITKTGDARTNPDGSLIFPKVTNYIQGEYICEASNRFGKKARKTVNVIVKIPLANHQNGTISTEIIIILTVSIVLLLLICLVVFIRSKNNRNLKSVETNMTSQELEELFEGKKQKSIHIKGGKDNLENYIAIDSLSYVRVFELSKDQFDIDKEEPIGSGAYGIVYRGTVTIGGKSIVAAFKTVKQEADISYVKALVTEIKVLIYIGAHPNIVNLIGAWTQNIRNREVYAAVEFCKFCLLNFLRENAQNLSSIKNEKTVTETTIRASYNNICAEPQMFTTYDLTRWSKEIAMGLEYMSFKKVIHGDVAARNVLLTEDLRAKICDFGLARQLIDYNYIKSEQCPLPWKWMAIESLNQMKFSEKSDMWAYGITLWEIYSLGNIPYSGQNWSLDFLKQLESGLRLTSPKLAPDAVYQLMMECWKANPSNRPSFSEVVRFFETLQIQRIDADLYQNRIEV